MAKLRSSPSPDDVNRKGGNGVPLQAANGNGKAATKAAPEASAAPRSMSSSSSTASATFLGFPMKWVSLVALTFQTSWQVFVIKCARASGSRYLNTTVVFIAEICKTFLSFALLAHEEGSFVGAARTLKSQIASNPVGTLRFCVPGLAYAIMNNLVFLSLDKLSAPVQQVTYQMKILTAAGLSVVMMRRTVSATQWCALLLLVVGVSVVQWPRGANGSLQAHDFVLDADAVIGLAAVVAAAFTGGFAGVYMEMMLKQAGSMWMRNAQLGFFGAWMSLAGVYFQDGERVREAGMFQGFTLWTCGPIFVLSTGGLMVAMVIKHADNILRQFSTALSIIITSLCSCLVLREFEPDWVFVFGAFLTIVATFMYNLGLPSWITAAAKAKTP